MKKLTAVLLALTLLLSLGVPALASEGDFTIENGVLTKYNGAGGHVTIPSGVTEIGRNAFSRCEGLTGVTIPSSVTSIGNTAFFYCTGLTSITIPSSVLSIGDSVFSGCTSLTSVTLENGLQTMGNSVFRGCTGLTGITIPASVTKFGVSFFWGCTSLSRVTMEGSLTQINSSTFQNCTSLTNITIPSGVAHVYASAFEGCTALASVSIPDSILSIGSSVFDDCASLTDVYYAGSSEQWDAIRIEYTYQMPMPGGNTAFYDCNQALRTATIHYNSPMPEAPAPETPDQSGTTEEPQATNPSIGTAYARTQPVSIDGEAVTLEAYALKDPTTGYETNYVKLRDVAYVLNGTAAQFNVGWDGNVNIVTGSAYVPNGSEMSTPFSGDRAYSAPTSTTNINGVAADLAAIVLNDDSGGGYTYYQLRDLGRNLGFNVSWSAERGIFIETDKPYTDGN